MVLFDYLDQLTDGIEFLIAFGSIIGVLGLIIGFVALFISGSRMRKHVIALMVFSFILVIICGFDTGINYFHIFR
ncbi:MAG: hypothetical protein EU533_01625 [Promethearchaeota archaeon]|nr:MAG: hypothetical protein EU533_01625 [Candidatus Lokiarchaeota archaeon]